NEIEIRRRHLGRRAPALRQGCYGLCQEGGVCFVWSVIHTSVPLEPPRRRAAGFEECCSQVWLICFQNVSSSLAAEMDWFSSTAHSAIRGRPAKSFSRDSFSQCDHSCQWKRNEQLNLRIGFCHPALAPSLRRS